MFKFDNLIDKDELKKHKEKEKDITLGKSPSSSSIRFNDLTKIPLFNAFPLDKNEIYKPDDILINPIQVSITKRDNNSSILDNKIDSILDQSIISLPVSIPDEKINKDPDSLLLLYKMFRTYYISNLSNKLKKLKKHLIYNKIQENLNKFHRIKAFINLKEKVQEKKLNREYLIELMKERVNKIEINYSFGIENNLLPSKITYNEIKIELLNKLKDQILKNNNDKPINQNYHLKISFFTEKIIFTKSKLFEDFFNIDNKNITFNETANCFNIKDLNNELIIDNTGTKINISILFSFVFIYPFKNIIEILTIPGLFNFSYGIIMLDFSNNYMINILLEVFQRKEMRKKKLLVFSILDGLSFTYTQDNIKIIKDLLKLGHEKKK